MTVGVVAFVALAIAANVLHLISIRFAADRTTVLGADGQRFDVLVHREGVMPYTRRAAWANVYGVLPAVIALVRHRRRGSWRWVVRARRAPFAGQRDLAYEVLQGEAEAHARAAAIADAIGRGDLPLRA